MKVDPARSSRGLLLGLLALGATPVASAAQDAGPPPGSGAWTTDLDGALAAAKAAQGLVLVCFNMDGEEANERALQMFRSDEFRNATDNVVCVLCSADEHGDADGPCPRFAGCTCLEHVACEKQARRHFFGASRDNLAPQHLLLFADGMVAWHSIYEVAPAQLFRAIAAAERSKAQTLEQRLRGQRTQLGQLSAKVGKGLPTPYMQVRALLVQTPAQHFCDALQALSKGVAEQVLRDLLGHEREQALALLEAATEHSAKALRDLATRLAAEVRARPPEVAPAATPPPPAQSTGPRPLPEPLPALGQADDFARVHWLGEKRTLADCRNRITVLWFFMLDAPDLASSVATMNEFAAANRSRGIETIGIVGASRPAEAIDKLPALGCKFPVGAYSAATGYRPCGVERFPSWVVLDPDTNVVHCSPQDGSSFDWSFGRILALRMAVTPSYAARISGAGPAK